MDATVPKAGCTGIVCRDGDPVAQLLAEAERQLGRAVAALTGLAPVPGTFDRLVVTSQLLFLAHAPALLAADMPCWLVLRAPGAVERRESWETALRLVTEILRLAAPKNLRLCTLTSERAREMSKLTGLEVTPLEPPALGRGTRHRQATLDAEAGLFRIGGGGAVHTTLPIMSRNWAHLAASARLGTLGAASEDLADLVAFADACGSRPATPDGRGATCVIVVPNGVGLGHLTRMLAVAEELRKQGAGKVVFWCFSRAAGLIEAAGHPVVPRQTAEHLACDADAWRRHETASFARFLQDVDARAVVYDGSAPDVFIARALNAPGNGRCGAVWIRRGMWQERADISVLEGTGNFDLVVEPGELAAEADPGVIAAYRPQHSGLAGFAAAPPVTLLGRSDLLDRRAARRAIGLGWGPACAVSLGGDAFLGHDVLTMRLREAAKRRGVRLVFIRSPLAGPAPKRAASAEVRHLYPASRYLAAFDAVVSAAGYNSFHELMLLYDRPVLFAPVLDQRLDDQVARADYAEAQGWASTLSPDTPAVHDWKIGVFFDVVRRRRRHEGRPRAENGAARIATLILRVAAGAPTTRDADAVGHAAIQGARK